MPQAWPLEQIWCAQRARREDAPGGRARRAYLWGPFTLFLWVFWLCFCFCFCFYFSFLSYWQPNQSYLSGTKSMYVFCGVVLRYKRNNYMHRIILSSWTGMYDMFMWSVICGIVFLNPIFSVYPRRALPGCVHQMDLTSTSVECLHQMIPVYISVGHDHQMCTLDECPRHKVWDSDCWLNQWSRSLGRSFRVDLSATSVNSQHWIYLLDVSQGCRLLVQVADSSHRARLRDARFQGIVSDEFVG